MRQNNNQQQNSSDDLGLQLVPIHETSLTKKVLQLEYEIQKTQKCYQATKKPIKYFSKIKRSLAESKNSHYNLEPGVLSQKIIPPNIGENFQYAEKPPAFQNPRLKNVFEAYKQTLEQKYRKKRRLMEKAALKINTSKIHENQAASEQIICEKQEMIKKRLSSKRLDPNMINSCQPSPMHRESLLRSVRHKSPSSRQLETIDDSNHNFVRSINKRHQISSILLQDHYFSTKQVSIYQVKKKCYSQERQNRPVRPDELNKTKNVSFKLPKQRRKCTNHFIEKIGGQTYNLPQISDKMNEKSDTISYLVKSLRKPSVSQNLKNTCNPQFNLMSKGEQPNSEFHSQKKKERRIRTLQIENNPSLLTQYSMENFFDAPQTGKNEDDLKSGKKRSMYKIKLSRTKRKFAKYNFAGNIDGWNTENEIPEAQSHLLHHFISLQPNLTYEEQRKPKMKALANSIQLLEQLRKQNQVEDDSIHQGTPIGSDKNYGSIKRFQSNQVSSNFNDRQSSKIPAFEQSNEVYFNNFSKGEKERNWGQYNQIKENMERNANLQHMTNEFRKDSQKLMESINQIFAKARNQQY